MCITLHDDECVGRQGASGEGKNSWACTTGRFAGGGGTVFAGSCAAAKQPDAASLLQQQVRSHMLMARAAPAAPSHRSKARRCRPPQRSAPSRMAAPVGVRGRRHRAVVEGEPWRQPEYMMRAERNSLCEGARTGDIHIVASGDSERDIS
eukprot:3316123-Prymnesium_polylepis.1